MIQGSYLPETIGAVDEYVTPEFELVQISEDVETDAESAGGKSCVVREEETGRLLAAYQAARLVHLDSPQYGIEDTTTSQLVHAWELQYKEAQAEYDFYCAQTTSDLAEIASAVHEKEALAAENAAQAGLVAAQATLKHKRQQAEKAAKAASERNVKEKEARALRRKDAQEKTDKIADEAIQKNTARLQSLPQITKTLYGTVFNAMTGNIIANASLTSTCLFTKRTAITRENGKFTAANAISGPTGRQCNVEVSHPGFVSSQYPVTVLKTATDGLYRTNALLPKTDKSQTFRFVVSYGASPPDLDAHVFVPMPNASFLDVGEHALVPHRKKSSQVSWSRHGAAEELPFTTMDRAAKMWGPETISVHNVNDGTYHFVIKNGASSFTTPRDFKDSSARAFLYQGNTLLNTVAINSAQGSPTQIWGAYTLSCQRGVCSLRITNKFMKSHQLPQ